MLLSDLARLIGARLIGDGDVDVSRVRHVEAAGVGDVALVDHAHDRRAARATRATAVIVHESFAADCAHELPCAALAVPQVPKALRLAIEALHPKASGEPLTTTLAARAPAAHPRAIIDDGADVAASARVAAGAVVCAGATVGAESVVGAGAVVLAGVRVGTRVVIGAGAVLGGAPFAFDDDGAPIAPAAGVVVGDGCVIGSNTCIDRGLVRDTTLGPGCRVDNLVQIGHDVVLGAGCVVVAQTGLAGFGTFGAGVTFGGQAGANPHVRVADRVRVGGQAGVTNDVEEVGAAVAGTPAFPHHAWLKAMARLKHLDELERRLRRLEREHPVHQRESE